MAAASAEWLLDFLAECNGCRIDALAVHDRSCHVEELAGHLNMYRPFALPLWLMEVGCDEHSAATTSKEYMREAVSLLEVNWGYPDFGGLSLVRLCLTQDVMFATLRRAGHIVHLLHVEKLVCCLLYPLMMCVLLHVWHSVTV